MINGTREIIDYGVSTQQDGTTNFVNGLPYFAVSVALMSHGRIVLAVVYDPPIADEIFMLKKEKELS